MDSEHLAACAGAAARRARVAPLGLGVVALGCAAGPPAAPPAPAPTARVWVADSCPEATQLAWPGPRGGTRFQLVPRPGGCRVIEHPPREAAELRARCVALDEGWRVTPVSAWVTARAASPEERRALCPAAPGGAPAPPRSHPPG